MIDSQTITVGDLTFQTTAPLFNNVPLALTVGASQSLAGIQLQDWAATTGTVGIDDPAAHVSVNLKLVDTVTQLPGHGTLTFSGTAVGSSTETLSADHTSVTFTGSVAEIRTDLSQLTYNAATAGKDFVFISGVDGPTTSNTYQIAEIDVTNPVITNHAPVLSAVSVPPVTAELANASAQLVVATGTLTVSDQDTGNTLTGLIAGPATASLNGGAVPATYTANVAALLASGALTFDSTVTANGTPQSIGWHYTPGAANLDFLAAGYTLTVTIPVEVNDGAANSGVQNVVVTITGTNDAAVIGTPTVADVTEDTNVLAGNLTATGTISITDADQGQSTFQTTVTGPTSNLGTLVLAANGAYTYTVANSAVQFLGATDTKVDTFTVTSFDGTTKVVSFTIHGQNDAPTVVGTVNLGSDVAGTPIIITEAQLLANAHDVDQGSVLHVTGLAAAAGSGALTDLGLVGGVHEWSFTPAFATAGTTVNFSYGVTDGIVTVPTADTASLAVSATHLPPVIISGGGGAKAVYLIDDDTRTITTVQATDPGGLPISYSLTDGRGHALTAANPILINSTTGVLSFKASQFAHGNEPDSGAYNVTVVAKDSSGLSTSQAITVKVGTEFGEIHKLVGNAGVTDTFVFKPGFGADIVQGFQTNGTPATPHSVLELDHALFHGAFAGETGSALDALISSHSWQVGRDTVIHTDTHEIILEPAVDRRCLAFSRLRFNSEM